MNSPLRRRLLSVGLVLGLLAGPAALAHHSGAMFDNARTVSLDGTVKAFQWSNPHCFIQIVVTSPSGPQEWSVEMGAPGQLYRNGWRPSSVKPGDHLTVVINPLRDGTHGGIYISATTADGKPVGAPRPAAGAAK